MKVKATQRGFYGAMREPGEEFEISDKADFSSAWMEEIKARGRPKKSDDE